MSTCAKEEVQSQIPAPQPQLGCVTSQVRRGEEERRDGWTLGSKGATLRNSRGHVNLLTNSSWRTNPTEKNEALSLMEPGKQSPFRAVGSREGAHTLGPLTGFALGQS